MEKFDPIDVEFLINSDEVKKASKKVKDEIKGIADTAEEAAAKVSGKDGSGGLKKPLEEAGNEAEKAGAKAGRSRQQWNGLGNSISQITRELPAFTYSAQTGFLAISNNLPILADEIAKIKAENKELTATGQKSIPVWRQVLSNLFSWTNLLSLGITLLTVFSPKIIEFVSSLFESKEALDENKKAVEALNKAYESSNYQKAIKDVLELKSTLNLAKQGLIDQEVALKKYNDTLGDALGKTNDINDAEQTLINKAPAYIEAMLYKAAATQATADAAKALADNQKSQFETTEEIDRQEEEKQKALAKPPSTAGASQGQFTNLGAQTALFNIAGLNAQLANLEKEAEETQEKSAKIVDELLKKSAEIAKAAGIDLFGDGGGDGGKRLINQRKQLLEKIAALDREYARKQLDQDAEELQALRDKFEKVRKLVEEFNADPKNAKVKIDLSGLNQVQQTAEADLIYKQQTRALKEELKKQKKIYEDYESYKEQFGVKKAKEQYKEQLKEFDSYAEFLKAKIKENEEAFTAVGGGTATGGQTDRVKLLNQEDDAEKKLQAKKYDELLAQLMDYEQKRNKLIEDYQEKRRQLIADGNIQEAAELKRQFGEQLSELDDSYVKGTDEYQALIRGVEDLSNIAARTVIENARKMVQALLVAGRISEETANEILDKIAAFEKEVDNRTVEFFANASQQIAQVAGAFLNLGDAVSYFDEGLGDSISTMGELGQVASDAASAIAGFASGTPQGIAVGISSTINAISGIFRIGAKARESARKAQAELERMQQEAEDGERRLNEILRDRNIIKAQEVELTLKGLQAQKEALSVAQAENKTEQAALFQEIQGLDYIARSYKEKYGGFLGVGRKTRVKNEYASLLGLTFEEIEKLYEQGKLEERAGELFEQLKKLRDEGEDINQMLGDIEAQAKEVFTGTTSNAIADSIIEGLRQGYNSFEDFAGDVESLLQGAILNAIQYQTLEEPIKNLYDQFSKYAESEGELTAAEAEAIRNQYRTQVQKAIDQYEEWSKVLDEDLLQGDQTQQGLQGAISRELTEETGSELAGLYRGQYDISKRHFQLSERHFEIEKKHYDATIRIMQHSAMIEQNTANTVTELQLALSELKIISKNTKPSQNSRDLGK